MARDILDRIRAAKETEVAEAIRRTPLSALREAAEKNGPRRPFHRTLAAPGPSGINIIAEIKRASPSKGIMAPDLDPAGHARLYEQGGAAALSVLTDGPFFRGSPQDLEAARNACALPVLRKDFIVSDYQVYESAVMGADAVLLIVRILPPETLRDLIALAESLGLAALVEIHGPEELEIADRAGARIIGVNNRDLASFDTDMERSRSLADRFSSRHIAVAESGIRTRRDIETLMEAGFFNFLIGESIVLSPRPDRFIRTLLGKEAP